MKKQKKLSSAAVAISAIGGNCEFVIKVQKTTPIIIYDLWEFE